MYSENKELNKACYAAYNWLRINYCAAPSKTLDECYNWLKEQIMKLPECEKMFAKYGIPFELSGEIWDFTKDLVKSYWD